MKERGERETINRHRVIENLPRDKDLATLTPNSRGSNSSTPELAYDFLMRNARGVGSF